MKGTYGLETYKWEVLSGDTNSLDTTVSGLLPVFRPDITTRYRLSLTNNDTLVQAVVTLKVNPLPTKREIKSGPDTVCKNQGGVIYLAEHDTDVEE